MLFDIHAAMQNADNFDPAFSGATVKNQVLADTVFEIAFPDVIARAAKIGLVRQIVECAVKLRQIADLLRFSPLPARVTANGKQIVPGFLREHE